MTPTPADVTRVLDAISMQPGAILARGPDGWLAIPPGPDGHVLTSTGPNTIPEWRAP